MTLKTGHFYCSESILVVKNQLNLPENDFYQIRTEKDLFSNFIKVLDRE